MLQKRVRDRIFAKLTVYCNDGSAWKVKEAISDRRYQQCDPPFEARQVFSCVCVSPPDAKGYAEGYEAVAKITYQVVGTPDTLRELEHYVEECEERASDDLQTAQDLLDAATQPAQRPHQAAWNEIMALFQLTKEQCPYTPHLLTESAEVVNRTLDSLAMPGGYFSLTVMTKVPGKHLTHNEYWAFAPEKREKIRECFKEALLAVWAAKVYHKDPRLSNIIWDEEGQKCYIVDFEKMNICTIKDPESHFDDDVYRLWGLKDDDRE